MIVPDVPTKLFTAFNKVTYFDDPHKYFIGKKQLISVTTLIHKFQEEFDEEFWSAKKSQDLNVPQKDVKHGWRYINKVGITRGSVVHDYAENLFQNKIFPYPKQRVEKIFGCDPIMNSYLKSKAHVDKFYRFSIGRLIPIITEYVVCDEEHGIGGMVDLLFYNIKAKEFQIWDWKTNKDFDFDGKEKNKPMLLGPLSFLKECDLEIYSLQLSFYKYIIEKNTGIKLGQSYIVWLSHLQKKFTPIPTLNRDIYIPKMIEAYAA